MPPSTGITGPDVSHYQGKVNWAAVAHAGNEFAIVQACDGVPTAADPHAVDEYFAANWKDTASAGLIRGAYCFSRPAPGRRAKEEVEHLARLVAHAGGLRAKGDLGLIPDFEWSAPGMSTAELERWVEEWWETARQVQGRWPITYTGAWWRDEGLRIRAKGPLWLAAYVDDPKPYVPKPSWEEYTIWQRSSDAAVAGIDGGCDFNVFNGHRADLEQLASLPKFAHHHHHAPPVHHHKPKPKPKPVKVPPAKTPPKKGKATRPHGAPRGLPRRFWHHWRFPWGARARNSGAFHRWLWQHGQLSPHFSRAEWACHDGQAIPDSLRKNAQRHAFNMERLRHELGDIPIPTISPYRDPAYNAKIGGASESEHMDADATDHSKEWVESVGRNRFIKAAEKVFAKGGLGTYPWGAFHVDSRGYRARWSSW